ncbi:MAG TPA: hypothetical protein VJV78_16915 [Polyangiales bacterium]|nr:hypothetical protein [Polyangiales bacterium]
MPESKREAVSGAHSIAPAWSDVTALGDSCFRIRLGGTFGSAWLARLCRGLASQRISIERAHAMRAPNRAWSAELHVRCLAGAPEPSSLPILQLIAAEVPDPGPLELDSYELTASTAHGGTLHLSIGAPDGLGLLGSLLAQLGKLTLYPIEMHIETQDGRAQDSLWLYTDQAPLPSGDLQEALERTLSDSLRTRSG